MRLIRNNYFRICFKLIIGEERVVKSVKYYEFVGAEKETMQYLLNKLLFQEGSLNVLRDLIAFGIIALGLYLKNERERAGDFELNIPKNYFKTLRSLCWVRESAYKSLIKRHQSFNS